MSPGGEHAVPKEGPSPPPSRGPYNRHMAQIEPSPTTFGALVRAFRQQRGWTQQDLAERWGFTREYVSQIERGKRKLYGEESVLRLAEILDIPLERLQVIGKYVPHGARVANHVAEADDALLEALLGPARGMRAACTRLARATRRLGGARAAARLVCEL